MTVDAAFQAKVRPPCAGAASSRELSPKSRSVKEQTHTASALEALENVVEDRIFTGPEDRPDSTPLLDPNRTKQSRQRKTLTWQEIPAWQRDNEYILTGYRRYVSL